MADSRGEEDQRVLKTQVGLRVAAKHLPTIFNPKYFHLPFLVLPVSCHYYLLLFLILLFFSSSQTTTATRFGVVLENSL